jgi:transposase
MANKPKSMTQIKRILQLLTSGHSGRNIASQLGISRNTVDYYNKQFKGCQTSFSDLLKLKEHELSKLIFKEQSGVKKDDRFERLAGLIPHFIDELKRRGVTRYLLWQEYKSKDTAGYSYQQFCEHLNTYLEVKSASMHFEHKPGDLAEFDFAGGKMCYVDQQTGEVVACPVFVSVLPYSGYCYALALADATLKNLIPTLGKCMEYFQGVPACVLTDNMRQIVKKTNRYEPSFTDLAEQWSVHYNTSLLTARPGKPKDKATVEKAVDLIYKRVFAPLRNQIFKSLAELNFHIAKALDTHNSILYQKKGISRRELFLLEEKELLRPLPLERFEVKYTVKAKVTKDYHITLGEDWHHYSVPYQYIGKQVTVLYTADDVEIYHNHDRIAFHKRDYRKNKFTTLTEHMPDKHKHYQERLGWNVEYFMQKASLIGPCTQELIIKITSSARITEQTYRTCLGILRLEGTYGKERLESACKLALNGSVFNYGIISTILSNNRDKREELPTVQTIPIHNNIRGQQTYILHNN